MLHSVSNPFLIIVSPISQMPSGAFEPLIETGLLLPDRMRDDANAGEYVSSSTDAAREILRDWTLISAYAFNCRIAWQEEATERKLGNAIDLMATLEELGFFLLQVLLKFRLRNR